MKKLLLVIILLLVVAGSAADNKIKAIDIMELVAKKFIEKKSVDEILLSAEIKKLYENYKNKRRNPFAFIIKFVVARAATYKLQKLSEEFLRILLKNLEGKSSLRKFCIAELKTLISYLNKPSEISNKKAKMMIIFFKKKISEKISIKKVIVQIKKITKKLSYPEETAG